MLATQKSLTTIALKLPHITLIESNIDLSTQLRKYYSCRRTKSALDLQSEEAETLIDCNDRIIMFNNRYQKLATYLNKLMRVSLMT